MADERFDIGADRSSQVTHESALPISKHPLAPFVNGPVVNTQPPLRCAAWLGNMTIKGYKDTQFDTTQLFIKSSNKLQRI
jgi:hypothetical protein